VGLTNAERQAAYRARKRAEVAPEPENPPEARLRARILELEEEVRHLKAELALRSRVAPRPGPSFNSRPFTPVPKSR
jgi:hypothetical protein